MTDFCNPIIAHDFIATEVTFWGTVILLGLFWVVFNAVEDDKPTPPEPPRRPLPPNDDFRWW